MSEDDATELLGDEAFATPAPDAPLVLIIEDDRFNVRLFTHLCRAAGLRAETAEDGEAGLAAVAAHSPDIVLLDLMLPKVDGFGVLSALRAAAPTADLPVIMVTAVQDAETRAKAIELGVDDFLTKPFRLPDLRARIESTLAQRALEAELRK